VALIWFCPTCRVGVRVPDDAPRSRIVFRCPRCRGAISFNDPPARPSLEEIEEVEAVEEEIPELEPVEPAPKWYGDPPPLRGGMVPQERQPERRPPRRPRRRRPAGTPWWAWLIAAGVAIVSLGLVGLGVAIALR
jgi:hypothetical protein